jgi:adenylate cyclase, class 2
MNAEGHPTENEIKIVIANPEDTTTLLLSKGFAVVAPRIFESNAIYDTPESMLRAQGCVLRLRTGAGGCVLTFKGPATQVRHKSRHEFETAVSDPANTAHILKRLGFMECFRYEKYRTEFARAGEPGAVMLDETPIGNFLEIEGTPAWVDATAHELGFDDGDYVTVSYGTLYRRYCEAHGRKASHMVFTA